jgi:branched-chain amino acid transport system substrate-binding protein
MGSTESLHGVGTAFRSKGKFGANTEGVMGIGGWSGDSAAIRTSRAPRAASRAADQPCGLCSLELQQDRTGLQDDGAAVKDLHRDFDQMGVKLRTTCRPNTGWPVAGRKISIYVGRLATGARAPIVPAEGAVIPITVAHLRE